MAFENEGDDPVGQLPVVDSRQAFTNAAVAVGLIHPGHVLNNMLYDYAELVVTMCARIADGYENPACPEDTVGDHIRAIYIESPRLDD